MPYKTKGNCVFKKDTGAKVGCTKGSVKKYLAALHANANESINEMEDDQIKGGLADKQTPDSVAKKFNISIQKINKQLNMGKKVEQEHTRNPAIAKEIALDHLVEIPDYYTRLDKMEKEALNHWKSKEVNESTKQLIKRLIRENIGLFNTNTPAPTSTFNILDGTDKVGTIVVGQLNKNFGKDTLEILTIYFNKDVNHLEIAKKTIIQLFETYPDINRLVMQPKPESRDFWFKLDGQRINDKFMIIFRAH